MDLRQLRFKNGLIILCSPDIRLFSATLCRVNFCYVVLVIVAGKLYFDFSRPSRWARIPMFRENDAKSSRRCG